MRGQRHEGKGTMDTGDLYVGVTRDPDFCHRSDHGGVVPALLRFALRSGMVDAVLAVKQGRSRLDGVLTLITDEQEVSEAVGSLHFATPGIAKTVRKYLSSGVGRIAVVCKSCDARALVELAKVGQVNIENLLMVGVNCSGTLLPAPHADMMWEWGKSPAELTRDDIADGRLVLEFGDTTRELDLDELREQGLGLRGNCLRCEYPIPRMADLACGKWGVEGEGKTLVEVCSGGGGELLEAALAHGVVALDAPSPGQVEERAGKEREKISSARKRQKGEFGRPRDKFYWVSEFANCTKCYGCRDACPLCHCTRCVLERDCPETVERGVVPPPPTFGMIRAYHALASCVNCGQCEDVCSADIPISRLLHQLNKQSQELFRYEAGVDLTARAPFSRVPDRERSVQSADLWSAHSAESG